MDGGPGAGLGETVGGIDGGMGAADHDGAVGLGRQLGHAGDDEDRDDHGDIIRQCAYKSADGRAHSQRTIDNKTQS